VASARNFLRKESTAYKATFPNEKIEEEEWKPEPTESSNDEKEDNQSDSEDKGDEGESGSEEKD
jgi:hypothetical protein